MLKTYIYLMFNQFRKIFKCYYKSNISPRLDLTFSVYQRCTIYTTLSPCPMCSGAIVLYKIPHVVVAESQTFLGAEEYLRSQGVRVDVLQNEECIQLMRDFISKNPTLWNEDIGVCDRAEGIEASRRKQTRYNRP